MLLNVLNLGLLSDLLCHLNKSEAKQLERASKTVRVFFTDSVKKEHLGRVANFYTKGVRVTDGIYDIYTMHGNTHVQLDAREFVADITSFAYLTLNGTRCRSIGYMSQFFENGQPSGVLIGDLDALVRSGTVIGIWVRSARVEREDDMAVHYIFDFVLERSGDLPQLTRTFRPIHWK